MLEASSMDAPRVLVVLNAGPAWSSGILRGFTEVAHERGWVLLHYHPPADFERLAREFSPAAVVIGPDSLRLSAEAVAPASVIAVAVDRSAEGIASACIDEEAVAAVALEHLLATGLRNVTTVRFDDTPCARARERAFIERARAAGVSVPVGWGSEEAGPARRAEEPAAVVTWLLGLPKPCGIFTCTDRWARNVARYIRLANLRVPEDLPLVGVDNDVLECELLAPPLSSVVVPWHELGRNAATLVQHALSGQDIEGQRLVSAPIAVLARRSSDILAVEDALVARAVRWIREHADRRVSVPMVAHAVGGGRQRLERRFRRVLHRTVVDEIRRAHVDAAKRLLQTTALNMAEVAKRSGFTNAALMSVAFQREIGMPPGVYRRRVQRAIVSSSAD
jgi:LacI family transcriptional regulator, galactose operon repressor